jgi:hypothetical protein
MGDSVKKYNDMVESGDWVTDSTGFNHTSKDPIVERVINKFRSRSRDGMLKYGTTLEDNPDGFYSWIQHAQEEAMDFILYLEKIKSINK